MTAIFTSIRSFSWFFTSSISHKFSPHFPK
nr:MAG TPA: hypothetical protein [Caudoviricetes sp.]DAZ32004.1 MAG TPA: hypothetical protein [Caudoviricetes sp.]